METCNKRLHDRWFVVYPSGKAAKCRWTCNFRSACKIDGKPHNRIAAEVEGGGGGHIELCHNASTRHEKKESNHNVNMHSLSLLRIDYYGIVYCELFHRFGTCQTKCAVFMWPNRLFCDKIWCVCVCIPYIITSHRMFPRRIDDDLHGTFRSFGCMSAFFPLILYTYFHSWCSLVRVLFACFRIVIIQQNCKFSLNNFFVLASLSFFGSCVSIFSIFFLSFSLFRVIFEKENHL